MQSYELRHEKTCFSRNDLGRSLRLFVRSWILCIFLSPGVAGEVEKKKCKKKNKLQNDSKTDKSNNKQNKTVNESEMKERINEAKVSTGSNETSEEAVKKRKKRKKKMNIEEKKVKMTDERLKAYGINPKKNKYMSKEELFPFKNKDDQ